MPFTKEAGRQAPSVAIVDFAFDDFDASGVAEVAIDLPSGVIVTDGYLNITTVFDSGTSDTLTVGDTTDDDEYASAIDGQALGVTRLVPTGVELTTENIVVKWTGVDAAPAQGAGTLVVEYVYSDRADFIQR